MKEGIATEDNDIIDSVIKATENVKGTIADALSKIRPNETADIRGRVFGNICELTNEALRQILKIAEDKICK